MLNWKKTIAPPTMTMLEVLEIIDKGQVQIALVVDEDQRLLGTVSDGDVRRAIIKGMPFESPISLIMNTNPTVAMVNQDRQSVLGIMKQKKLHQIPVVDDYNRVMYLEVSDHLIEPEPCTNCAVLMVGGEGLRLRPLTENCPKPLLKVGNKPILETILENLITFGFKKFYFSINYRGDMIRHYFGDGSKWGVDIAYLHENKQLGTAGSLSLLPERPKDPILVMNGDLLTSINFQQLLSFHQEQKSVATMCIREYDIQIPYGVVNINKNKFINIEEKPVHSFFINAGIYLLNPEVLDFIPWNSRYDMPELFQSVAHKGEETAVFPIREYWLDIGRMGDYEKANGEYETYLGYAAK